MVTSLGDFARLAAGRIEEILRRGRRLATIEAVVAAVAGVFCLIAVAAALSDSARGAWLAIGLVPCAIPAGAALVARQALAGASRASGIASDVSRLKDDPAVRRAIADIGDALRDRRHLVASGRRLLALRRIVSNRRSELTDLWASLLAITRLPLLAGVAAIGSLILGAIGVVATIVALLT
ncbi:MAG: hypothetical protein H0V96_10760 [Acidimicrobiia bacterium]|nr:hypothetical protein [Acidimicrobiia bacterium]